MTFAMPAAPIVVDASFIVDGLVGNDVVSAAIKRWTAADRILLGPAIVWPEIANALRRRRTPAGAIARDLDLVLAAGLETADRGPMGVAYAAGLAERHRLSTYDATYLWLAIDVDGELATFDRALVAAAKAEGVTIAEGLEPGP
jgi:predicted nucleic acid-binding protein